MLILTFDTDEEKNMFLYLYDNYKHYVLYTIRRYVKDIFTEEDLFQDILIILAKNINKIDFQDKRRTTNFVITVSKNYTLNYIKKQGRQAEDLTEDIGQLRNTQTLPLDYMLKQEEYQELYKELEKLDEKYQAVLELKYFADLNDDSISEILGITKKNVQTRLYRAKLKMKSGLSERLKG